MRQNAIVEESGMETKRQSKLVLSMQKTVRVEWMCWQKVGLFAKRKQEFALILKLLLNQTIYTIANTLMSFYL